MPHPTTDALGATLSAGQTYNFGKAFSTITPGGILSTPREISQDLTIQNGGQLWINRKDRIADVSNTNNPQNIKPQAFFVSVPGDRCGGSQKVVVTIEDGGKLLVGDNASSPKNTGGLYFTSSSELYAFGSDPITLEDDAELTFDKNSRIELKTSAKLQAKNNVLVSATESTFVMESNSKIVFESNGDFRLDNTSLDVPAGSEIKLLNATSLSVTGQTSVLHIHAGATLRLSGESTAKIGSGATLILDPGAIIILESPESNIRIEGTLVWNGDINFSGLGYFEFTKTHALELNADAFRLTGAGKNNRFIRIGGETTLNIPENKGLDLENGAVEHHGYEIQLNKASWCNLEGVKMYGTAAIGFLGVQVGDIVVDDCTFDGLTSPFEITGSDNNVCYVDKTSPEPLPAKLNFWGNTWGGTTYADVNPNWSISLRKSTPTSVSCGASFTADVSQALQDEPTGCARQIGPIDPDECNPGRSYPTGIAVIYPPCGCSLFMSAMSPFLHFIRFQTHIRIGCRTNNKITYLCCA